MGKSAPAAPDPVATAQAQATANAESARVQSKLNNPNTYGPGGAVEHEWGPDDTSSVYTYLSPEQQKIYDNQTALTGATSKAALDATGRMQTLLGTGLDLSGLPAWNQGPQNAPQLTTTIGGAGQYLKPTLDGAGAGVQTSLQGAGQGIASQLTGAGQGVRDAIGGAGQGISYDYNTGAKLDRVGTQDYGAQRDQVVDALMSRVQPQYDRDRTAQDARLAAQGFMPGTEGYKSASDEINRTLTDARMQAQLAGGQEQSRLFGMDLSRVQANNAASGQETTAYNSALQARNAAQAQGFGEQAQEAAFGNSAQAQRFGQVAQAGAFQNAAQAQGFGQQQAAGEFANQAQAQVFGQGAQKAAFENQAQDQWYQQRAQEAAFGNTAATQGLNQQFALAQNDNATRAAMMAEQMQLRAQPINEVSALFGLGNGVQVPQQAQVSPAQVAAPDYQGLVQSNYKQQVQQVGQDNATAASAATAVAAAAAIAI